MILMIDNYDSFTFNLVQYFKMLNVEVIVKRNDEISMTEIADMKPSKIVISPGPCSPDESGVSLKVVERFSGSIPLLGVCLGHQAIAQFFGAKIVLANEIMHGKTSSVFHNCSGVFDSIPSPFSATRYHSLTIDPDSIPDCLEVTAWTKNIVGKNDTIMGIRHKTQPVIGVQFHPESILSEYGHLILENFLKIN